MAERVKLDKKMDTQIAAIRADVGTGRQYIQPVYWLRDLQKDLFGRPEEVANVALFLVSDEAGYVSGAVYSITGG